MMKVQTPELKKWLTAEGEERGSAVQAAADTLLSDYFKQWPRLIPVELHRLASTLKAEIIKSDSLKGEAVLMPVCNGFKIVVTTSVSTSRQRTSIAHEFVHTLFYKVMNGNVPTRRLAHTPREEHFCYDVARHILAPRQHLQLIGVLAENNAEVIIDKLINKLLLSRPWAARVMLADYKLARGIAGRWKLTEKGWSLEYGSSSASPELKQKERRIIRDSIRSWLENRIQPPSGLSITGIEEKSGEGIFVLAVQT